MSETCIMLLTSMSADQILIVNSRRMEDLLAAKKLQVRKIDGSAAESKEERDKLFAISDMRGKYPQLFITNAEGESRFVGVWDDVESLIESDSLPEEILAANPGIPTFNKVFANVARVEE